MPPEIVLGERRLGPDHPTWFVADIAANHDGDLDRAKLLIRLAAEAGADAAKFQNFAADTIVSDQGFRELGGLSHQAAWEKPVHDVYADASLELEWTPILREECERAGIEYFTSPYSLEIVDAVDPDVRLYKIGSGEITWPELLDRVAGKGKPVLLACGASDQREVDAAVAHILRVNDDLVLMQCNTNYTGSLENLHYVNLRVLETFRQRFPQLVVGLSDHTPGHATVLGAVALGARVIEKHFTDDRTRVGPDHAFSMTPAEWREMVDRTRELEAALGDGVKRVEANEQETVVVQRRALHAQRAIAAGETIADGDLIPLRPCPPDAATPADRDAVVGRTTARAIAEGEPITWSSLA
jgi:N-acetylneuraminate synthase